MTENKDAENLEETAELEAAEKVESEVEQAEEEEISEEAELKASEEAEVEQIETAAAPGPKKGLMQRRKSFSQGSVPNAHRGYNPKTPVIMMGIIVVMVIASFILAAIAG